MLVKTPFCFALVARSRRRELKLRQSEVATAAGVGREWLIALEHGKPGLDFGKVLHTLDTLGVEISLYQRKDVPTWARPLLEAAATRDRRIANLRPRRRASVPRPEPTPPTEWRDGDVV